MLPVTNVAHDGVACSSICAGVCHACQALCELQVKGQFKPSCRGSWYATSLTFGHPIARVKQCESSKQCLTACSCLVVYGPTACCWNQAAPQVLPLHACRFLVDHWLKSLLLESSSVSAEEMLSPESVPRLPSWFVAHKTGLPRLPFLFVLNNELRLHPSLEGMGPITPGRDQLNSLGALVSVTLWVELPGRHSTVPLAGLCVSCDALLQQASRTSGCASTSSLAARRSGPCLAACCEHLAALHLHWEWCWQVCAWQQVVQGPDQRAQQGHSASAHWSRCAFGVVLVQEAISCASRHQLPAWCVQGTSTLVHARGAGIRHATLL